MDVGAVTPFLWGFEEQEKLMEFHELSAGSDPVPEWTRLEAAKGDVLILAGHKRGAESQEEAAAQRRRNRQDQARHDPLPPGSALQWEPA